VKPVRRLILADNSEEKGVSIQATFWGEICRKLNYAKGTVIALKAIKVGSYNGKSLNVSEENMVTTEYKGRERDLLERWVATPEFKTDKIRCLTEIKESFKPG
jgi:hypothetical protein